MNKIDVGKIDKKWQLNWSSKKNQFKNTDKKKTIIRLFKIKDDLIETIQKFINAR